MVESDQVARDRKLMSKLDCWLSIIHDQVLSEPGAGMECGKRRPGQQYQLTSELKPRSLVEYPQGLDVYARASMRSYANMLGKHYIGLAKREKPGSKR